MYPSTTKRKARKMSKVFITGDRSQGPFYIPLVAIELLRAVNDGDEVATGENGGVEQIVRDVAERAGVHIRVVPGDKSMFAERHAALAKEGYTVVVVHSAPEASSLLPSVLEAFPADNDVRIVTHADLMV